MPSVSHLAPIHLGLDVHKDTISVAILAPDRDGPAVDRISHDEPSVRRLVGRLGDPRWLQACYEAGPTGYDLARLLESLQVRCEVIAPSLIPKAPGDKVRDRPARLPAPGAAAPGRGVGGDPHPHRPRRSGPGSVPGPRRPHPRPASAGQVPAAPRPGLAGGNAWTLTHERWLLAQRFDQPALRATDAHYRAVLDARDAALEAIEAELAGWYDRPPFAEQVARLAAYRGITRLGALTLPQRGR